MGHVGFLFFPAFSRIGCCCCSRGDGVLFDPVCFDDEGPLEDDPALLVPLVLLRGVLVHPAQFRVAILAENVTHHVTAGQHGTVLHLAEVAEETKEEEEEHV